MSLTNRYTLGEERFFKFGKFKIKLLTTSFNLVILFTHLLYKIKTKNTIDRKAGRRLTGRLPSLSLKIYIDYNIRKVAHKKVDNRLNLRPKKFFSNSDMLHECSCHGSSIMRLCSLASNKNDPQKHDHSFSLKLFCYKDS